MPSFKHADMYVHVYLHACNFACIHVHTTYAGARMGVVFADMLTQLFEEMAGVLDKYYPVIHSCYGNGYTLHFVRQLQVTFIYTVGMF